MMKEPVRTGAWTMATEVRTIDAGHRLYRLSAEQFEGMIEAGLISENDDLELSGRHPLQDGQKGRS